MFTGFSTSHTRLLFLPTCTEHKCPEVYICDCVKLLDVWSISYRDISRHRYDTYHDIIMKFSSKTITLHFKTDFLKIICRKFGLVPQKINTKKQERFFFFLKKKLKIPTVQNAIKWAVIYLFECKINTRYHTWEKCIMTIYQALKFPNILFTALFKRCGDPILIIIINNTDFHCSIPIWYNSARRFCSSSLQFQSQSRLGDMIQPLYRHKRCHDTLDRYRRRYKCWFEADVIKFLY